MDKEINRPAKLLGYRAMNQKLRTEYSIHVPRQFAHNVMREVHPEGIAARQVNKKTTVYLRESIVGCIS